jgi:hypothetical protein
LQLFSHGGTTKIIVIFTRNPHLSNVYWPERVDCGEHSSFTAELLSEIFICKGKLKNFPCLSGIFGIFWGV